MNYLSKASLILNGFLIGILVLSLTANTMYKKEMNRLVDDFNKYEYVTDCNTDPKKTDKEDPFGRKCAVDGKWTKVQYNAWEKFAQWVL